MGNLETLLMGPDIEFDMLFRSMLTVGYSILDLARLALSSRTVRAWCKANLRRCTLDDIWLLLLQLPCTDDLDYGDHSPLVRSGTSFDFAYDELEPIVWACHSVAIGPPVRFLCSLQGVTNHRLDVRRTFLYQKSWSTVSVHRAIIQTNSAVAQFPMFEDDLHHVFRIPLPPADPDDLVQQLRYSRARPTATIIHRPRS